IAFLIFSPGMSSIPPAEPASANKRAAAGPVVSSLVRKLRRQPIKILNGSRPIVRATIVRAVSAHRGASARRAAIACWISKRAIEPYAPVREPFRRTFPRQEHDQRFAHESTRELSGQQKNLTILDPER